MNSKIGNLKDLDNIKTKKGSKLCLGLECLDRDLWEFEPAFPLIEKIGIKRVRIQSGWQKTEKTPGVYDFSWLDEIVDKLKSSDIDPFLSLSYGNKLYCENKEDCPNLENGGVGHIPVKYEREKRTWQAYVKATVEHYKDRISHYEIWNEPDCATFCCVDMPWADAYIELIKLTSPVIRKIQPDAKIISCTVSADTVKLLADRGLSDFVDIHSFHDYSHYPETSPGCAKANKLSYLKEKAPNLKFWRGEAGFPSYNDPKSKGALSDVSVSETKQAKFLLRHLVLDISEELIECTSYFHAYDFLHFTKTHHYYYGVIRHEDLTKKPSYNCLQVLAHIFSGEVKNSEYKISFVKSRESDLNDLELLSLKTLSFEKDGKTFFAYWLPIKTEDEPVLKKGALTIPYIKEMQNPVIVDPFTREIYSISDDTVIIRDYPMFVFDRDSILDIADIEKIEKTTKEEKIEQIVQE